MALSLNDAITEVRYGLNEATAAYWTDAEITDYIQEGCRVFSSKSLLVEDTQDIDPLIAGQLYYDSSDETWIGDCLEIHTALYDDGSSNYKGLIKIQPKQIGHATTFEDGDPKYYSLFDRKIFVWPLTTAGIAGTGIITVLYAKETDDITAINDEFQHLPIMYAVAKARFKEKDFGGYTQIMTQFYTEVGSERSDKWVREIDVLQDFNIPTGRGQQPNG